MQLWGEMRRGKDRSVPVGGSALADIGKTAKKREVKGHGGPLAKKAGYGLSFEN